MSWEMRFRPQIRVAGIWALGSRQPAHCRRACAILIVTYIHYLLKLSPSVSLWWWYFFDIDWYPFRLGSIIFWLTFLRDVVNIGRKFSMHTLICAAYVALAPSPHSTWSAAPLTRPACLQDVTLNFDDFCFATSFQSSFSPLIYLLLLLWFSLLKYLFC